MTTSNRDGGPNTGRLTSSREPVRHGRRRLGLGRVSRLAWFSVASAAFAGFVIGWFWVTSNTAGQVRMAWGASPQCVGATMGRPRTAGGALALQARRGMHCVVTVVISNHSGHTVHLQRARAAWLGPAAGAVVKADPPAPRLPGIPSDDIDAYYNLDVDLGAGQSRTFTIGIGFRDSGCSGVLTTFLGWPTVDVRFLGRTFEVRADNNFAFIQDGPASGCTAPEN